MVDEAKNLVNIPAPKLEVVKKSEVQGIEAIRLRPEDVDKVTSKVITDISLGRFADDVWFRVLAKFDLMAMAFRYRAQDKFIKVPAGYYVASPEIARAYPRFFKLHKFYLLITRGGDLKLWPMPLPNTDGQLHSAHQAGHDVCEIAMERWIRISWDGHSYPVEECQVEVAEPVYPDLTDDQIVKMAITGRKWFINSIEHPFIQQVAQGGR